eukprot:9022444-Pyramimonas_sp.AAC.1
MGPRSVRGVCRSRCGGHARQHPLGPSVEWSPLWGRETCEGRAEIGRRRHADGAIGTIRGAPDGATKRARCAPTWGGVAMRTAPLRPCVEPPLGPRHA